MLEEGGNRGEGYLRPGDALSSSVSLLLSISLHLWLFVTDEGETVG